jgi:hypothetical protein
VETFRSVFSSRLDPALAEAIYLGWTAGIR